MDAPPNRSFSTRGLILVLTFIILAVSVIYVLSIPHPMPVTAPLTDLQSIDALRAQFNQDAGKTRLILLVSPT